MKILIATPDFPLWDGGIATVAFEVAQGLQKLGHDVDVMAPEQTSGDFGFDKTLPFRVHRVKNIKSHILKAYYHIFKMGRLVKKFKYDIIMAQSWYPSGIAASYAKEKHNVKMTVTVHGNEILNPRYNKPYWEKRLRGVFDNADHIFCVSDFTSKKLISRLNNPAGLSKRIKVIHNGVDFEYFRPSPPDKNLIEKYGLQDSKVMLTLARLVERKGHDMVIKALPIIKKRVPNVKYIICGKGGYEEKLKELAEGSGMSKDVIFTGFLPNEQRADLYNICDLFIMPSRDISEKGDIEGFGITYLEANACEKPVIGSHSGGASEAIVEGESGLLVDPDDKDDIAEKCIKLLSDPKLAGTIGSNGRKRIMDEFNWDNICSRIEKILDH